MAFEISRVENGDTPNTEKVRLKATTALNTKGFALVDKTFDAAGNLSNEFRHIYIFPDLQLEKNEVVILYTGTGTNGKKKYGNVDEYYQALYWGSDHCVWNNGGDTATLINYIVADTKPVPALKKK
jgi:hypothetical protein